MPFQTLELAIKLILVTLDTAEGVYMERWLLTWHLGHSCCVRGNGRSAVPWGWDPGSEAEAAELSADGSDDWSMTQQCIYWNVTKK